MINFDMQTNQNPSMVPDLSNKLFVQQAELVAGYVPYTGATTDVDLGVHNITATDATITGSIILNGSFSGAYRAITAIRTLDTTDYLVDCTSNTFTVTLPTAVGSTGRIYIIKNSGSGIITIATTSSQTVDGETTQTLTQWDALAVMSTGTGWIII